MSDVLSIENLCLRRGSFCLDNISFSVRPGEILAIIGKTGSGKTLLLETASGLCRPDAGQVLYQGTPMHEIPCHRRNIGYLYQDYSLFPHMTAAENIGYSLRMKHRPKEEIRRKVQEIAQRFEIDSILGQYPGTLSGGEKQRVALARALMMRPPLLFLDEPFSALDPVTKSGLYDMFREIQRDFQCAVLFVTHDFAEAEHLADRVGVLISGKLRGIVSSRDLFTADWEEDVQSFLGIQNARKEVTE